MKPPSVEPHLFVILGASGDLTSRKLLPALYEMITRQGLGEGCRILGVSGSPLNDESFRARAREALEEAGYSDDDLAAWCDRALHYERARGEYEAVADRIKALEDDYGLPGNRVIYLALPPQAFQTTIEGLGRAGLNSSPGWTRLVIEKPFGRDLDSARNLNTLKNRFTALITIWAKRRSRTSWFFVLPMRCSRVHGIAIESRTSRSRFPRTTASALAPAITRRPGLCATWSRAI